ncbi:MAG: terminase small subunit [Candidatus Omnitrophica bacterium]|nr:terminase small subunit [Candidatus Omnitrophota bacterium]
MGTQLSVKQQRFVQYYNGNATMAAIEAGYSRKTARSQGQRLLTNVDILMAVKEREKGMVMAKIATRQERQEFWTRIMQDGGIFMRERLKASELLGKSEADFTEKVALSGVHSLAERVKAARERVYRDGGQVKMGRVV